MGDLGDLGAIAQLAADMAHQIGHRLHQRAGAAHGVVHAPPLLQIVDQAVERGGVERIAADEQRMKAQREAQFRAFHPVRDIGVDAVVPAQPQQPWQHGDHLVDLVKRLVRHFRKGEIVDALAVAGEAVIARQIVGRDAGDLGAHRRRVAGAVHHVAVVEADLVERVEPLQRHVLREIAPAQLPDVLEHERRGDDGRPGVEGEAVLSPDIGAPAGAVEPLQHRHLETARAQPRGGGEAAEARADHDRLGSALRAAAVVRGAAVSGGAGF